MESGFVTVENLTRSRELGEYNHLVCGNAATYNIRLAQLSDRTILLRGGEQVRERHT